MNDWVEQASDRIKQAAADKQTLTIRGGNSKHFYGNAASGEVLSTLSNSAIVDYEPRELTITAETEDGIIMGVRHRRSKLEGVQFHPESVLTTSGKQLLQNFLSL